MSSAMLTNIIVYALSRGLVVFTSFADVLQTGAKC